MAAVVKELLILFGLSRVNSSILDFRIFHCHTAKPFFCPHLYVCLQVYGSPVQRNAWLLFLKALRKLRRQPLCLVK